MPDFLAKTQRRKEDYLAFFASLRLCEEKRVEGLHVRGA